MSNFVPNLLLHTDLPEVTRSIAPRRAILAGMVDGAGTAMGADAVRAAYGGAGNVEVGERAAWDAASLAAL